MPKPVPKILIVEDNPENRELIAEILREIAACVFAANADEAFAAFDKAREEGWSFATILLDLELPEISGLQILEKIRADEKKAGVLLGDGLPVIVVTGHQDRFLQAFNQGCDDYILKPIDAGLLIAKITALLARE